MSNFAKKEKKLSTPIRVTEKDADKLSTFQQGEPENVQETDEENLQKNLWVADSLKAETFDRAPNTTFSRQQNVAEQEAAKSKDYRSEKKAEQEEKDRIAREKVGHKEEVTRNFCDIKGPSVIKKKAFTSLQNFRYRLKGLVCAGFRKEHGLELRDSDKKVLEANNYEELLEAKQKDMRADNLNILNSEDPFIEIRAEMIRSDLYEYDKIVNEAGEEGPRQDLLGHERRANQKKYRKGGSKMEMAVEKDMNNLVQNLYMDLLLSGQKVEFEEPLLTALKAYSVFTKAAECTILEKEVQENELKDMSESMKELVEKGVDNPNEYAEQIETYKSEVESLKSSKKNLQSFYLKLKVAVAQAIDYNHTFKQLKAVRLAEELIKDSSPEGQYKTRMLEKLKAKDEELAERLKLCAVSTFMYERNEGGVQVAKALSKEQYNIVQTMSETFDKVRELQGKEGAEDKADTLMNEARLVVNDYKGLDD